jgi:hypothetical protein
MPTTRKARAAVIIAGLTVLALAGCQSTAHRNTPSGPTTTADSTTTTVPASSDPAGALEKAFVRVVAKVRPQVVEISTGAGLGSGVVYDT